MLGASFLLNETPLLVWFYAVNDCRLKAVAVVVVVVVVTEK